METSVNISRISSNMDESQRKEQFSNAYVRAIASVGGFRVSEPNVDDDSIDMTLAARGGTGFIRSSKLDLQLKCTASGAFESPQLAYSLKIKNYDELRDPRVMVPRILVVVVVPEKIDSWLLHDEEKLSMHHCAYWLSLRGFTEKAGQKAVTVRLPRTQQFNVAGVADIMSRLTQGGFP